jgi:tetratricopeptide (TPR) repeat protein
MKAALAIVAMLSIGSATGWQDAAVQRAPDRLDRLRQWLAAVERHEPGASDEPLIRVASWDRKTLWLVWMDVGTIVSFVRDPDIGLFFTPSEPEPFSGVFKTLQSSRLAMQVIPYTREDIRRLRTIAVDVMNHGGEDRILKRGAVLHADIAMRGAIEPSPEASARGRRSETVVLLFSDGQQTSVEDAGVQWEMGRRLLDKVKPKSSRKLGPDPGADEAVRVWFLATTAYMQKTQQVDPWHIDRSVQLFPRDPEVLFFAGCAREWLSGPQIQNALQSTTLSRDLFNMVGDESAELRKAERLFRESLEHDPMRAEARIRLGRILGRRGRHQDAIVELRRATMDTDNRLLQYYGQMFLGAEAAALNLGDDARRAYQRASELYPDAQSPRLAISALAVGSGDRAGAMSAIAAVIAADEPRLSDDPWWSYYRSSARDLEGIVEALHEAVRKPGR